MLEKKCLSHLLAQPLKLMDGLGLWVVRLRHLGYLLDADAAITSPPSAFPGGTTTCCSRASVRLKDTTPFAHGVYFYY